MNEVVAAISLVVLLAFAASTLLTLIVLLAPSVIPPASHGPEFPTHASQLLKDGIQNQ